MAASSLPPFAWAPLYGRSPQDINNENAQEVRQKRQALISADPSSLPTVLPDPQWDAFFGGLDRAKDTAAANGQGFSVNWNGFGNSTPSLTGLQHAMTRKVSPAPTTPDNMGDPGISTDELIRRGRAYTGKG